MTQTITHTTALEIAEAMLAANIDGAAFFVDYVKEQIAVEAERKTYLNLTDREWSNIAAKRAEEAATVAQDVRERHNALVIDNRTLWARLEALEQRLKTI